MDIVLATHNARWIHTAFGLRCLRANLGELRERCALVELDPADRPADAVERVLAFQPRVVGLGVYVWNARAALAVARVLRRVAPGVSLVVGGPEVSHETQVQELCGLADWVVRGEGERVFADLCRRILRGDPPSERVLDAQPPPMDSLASPYGEYTDEDVAHRVVYVEASRGCPYRCEFCLSALDAGVRRVALPDFLRDLERLHARGVRHFKFVDRTFNLDVDSARAILEFFLPRAAEGCFAHFEMVPDRFPAPLRTLVESFPPGALQFEVGVQTFDAQVAERISRHQDFQRTRDNLTWLRRSTGVHVHADLLAGLPGESLADFGRGFDALFALAPHEIQIGVLKRLRGAPIARHDEAFEVNWDSEPPYEILSSRELPFADAQRIKRLARTWDALANSGHWPATLALLAATSPFDNALAFSEWLHATQTSEHGLRRERMARALHDWLSLRGHAESRVRAALVADWTRGGPRGLPAFLRDPSGSIEGSAPTAAATTYSRSNGAQRQARHRS